MNCIMKTKFVLAIYSWCPTICLENDVNFEWAYTCSFQQKILSNLTCVLTKCFREGSGVSWFENIVIFAERYP